MQSLTSPGGRRSAAPTSRAQPPVGARKRTRTIRPDGSRKTTAFRSICTTTRGPTASPTPTIAPSMSARRRSWSIRMLSTFGSGSVMAAACRSLGRSSAGDGDTRLLVSNKPGVCSSGDNVTVDDGTGGGGLRSAGGRTNGRGSVPVRISAGAVLAVFADGTAGAGPASGRVTGREALASVLATGCVGAAVARDGAGVAGIGFACEPTVKGDALGSAVATPDGMGLTGSVGAGFAAGGRVVAAR